MCIDILTHVCEGTVSEFIFLRYTCNQLPSVSSMLLVSEDSEQEDSDHEDNGEDKRLHVCASFFQA